MDYMSYILPIIIFLPTVGALFLMSIKGTQEEIDRNARRLALWVSGFTFALSLLLWINFDASSSDFQFLFNQVWIQGTSIAFHVGVDGISLFFILLSTFLVPVCILASWEMEKRIREYMIAFLLLETMMVGMFSALDTVLFYIFFEGVLIPMFLIIGIWGGPNRIYATFKFFLYTLLGSVLMLLAIIMMYSTAGTTNIPDLMDFGFSNQLQSWLWLAFFASFAVKVPMWPVHTWLPDAHVEAPTAGSVILAGVLLKMGGYGFLRFSLPMFPDATVAFTPLIYTLSVVAVIYTSLVALAQTDMKKLIAYSSVAHMGFVTIGIFTLNIQGIQGSLIQMISHGFVSAALFLCVGTLYNRIHSRLIDDYGGVVNRMPLYAFVFMIFMLASVGLPGTSGFVGEFLVLLGAFKANTWVSAFAATGLVLGATYMLWLYRRVVFGKLTKENLMELVDLSPREIATYAPLVFVVLWIGIYPTSLTSVMDKSVEDLIVHHQNKLAQRTSTVNDQNTDLQPLDPLPINDQQSNPDPRG